MQLSYIYAVENESAVWHLAQHRNIKKHFSHVCQCLVNYIETLNIRRVPIFEIEGACPHRKPFGFNWIRLCVKNNGTIWIPTLAWEREREISSAVGVLSPYFSVLLVILSGSKTTSEYLHNSHSQDILCRVNISNTRGDPLRQLQNKSLCPKDIRFRAHILNTQGDHYRQH